mmetsp:Transcript_2409/g.10016  ORF Transcript_2409/g.10016 Transcript_2409/m.10016 type:complete len:555 (+) Transcript_2409:1864-3528(+)
MGPQATAHRAPRRSRRADAVAAGRARCVARGAGRVRAPPGAPGLPPRRGVRPAGLAASVRARVPAAPRGGCVEPPERVRGHGRGQRVRRFCLRGDDESSLRVPTSGPGGGGALRRAPEVHDGAAVRLRRVRRARSRVSRRRRSERGRRAAAAEPHHARRAAGRGRRLVQPGHELGRGGGLEARKNQNQNQNQTERRCEKGFPSSFPGRGRSRAQETRTASRRRGSRGGGFAREARRQRRRGPGPGWPRRDAVRRDAPRRVPLIRLGRRDVRLGGGTDAEALSSDVVERESSRSCRGDVGDVVEIRNRRDECGRERRERRGEAPRWDELCVEDRASGGAGGGARRDGARAPWPSREQRVRRRRRAQGRAAARARRGALRAPSAPGEQSVFGVERGGRRRFLGGARRVAHRRARRRRARRLVRNPARAVRRADLPERGGPRGDPGRVRRRRHGRGARRPRRPRRRGGYVFPGASRRQAPRREGARALDSRDLRGRAGRARRHVRRDPARHDARGLVRAARPPRGDRAGARRHPAQGGGKRADVRALRAGGLARRRA